LFFKFVFGSMNIFNFPQTEGASIQFLQSKNTLQARNVYLSIKIYIYMYFV